MKKLLIALLFVFTISVHAQDWKELSLSATQSLRARKFDDALNKANQALEKVIEAYGENSTYQATQLGLIGRIYYSKGDYSKAVDYFILQKEILDLKNKTNSRAYGSCMNNLAVCYKTIGENNKVESLLMESIRIKKSISGGLDSSYAKSLSNLGEFYIDKGDYPKAETYLSESLEIKRKLLDHDNSSIGITLFNLGMLYEKIGNKELAKENLIEGVDILEKTLGKSHPTTANMNFEIANVFISEGNKEEGEKYLSKSKAVKEALMKDINVESASSLYNMAKVDIKLEKYTEANEILTQILPAVKTKLGQAHPLYGQIINASGIVHWISGDLEGAYTFFAEAEYLAEAIYGKNNINYANATLQFAGLLKELEYLDEADQKYFNGFDTYLYLIENYFPYYSESEKTKFYQLVKEQFDKFNSYALQRYVDNPKIIEKMYDYHIATKGILLDYSKNLLNVIEKSNDEALKKDYLLWKSKKEQLAKLYNYSPQQIEKMNLNIDSLEQFSNTLEKSISKRSELFNDDIGSKIPTWKQVQTTLGPNEAVVEIIRFKFFSTGWKDSTYYVALISTNETIDGPEMVIFENGNLLDSKYLNVHKKTIKSKFPDKRSYGYYWKDIQEKIDEKEIIYLSADGVYNIINPSCLRTPNNDFVIDNEKIIYLNNSKELINRKAESPRIQTAELFGFPKYKVDRTEAISDEDLENAEKNEILIAPLPGTKKEIDIISGLLSQNNWSSNNYLQENASEANFKELSSPGIIHIATHGYFLSDLTNTEEKRVFGIDKEKAIQNPLLRAGLMFSGASNFLNYDFRAHNDDENGILTAYEVKNLDLRGTDLVIMSACETGLGKIMNGEGVYGLQRAFQVAGVNAIIMSLWTVDDRATQEMMVEFYKNYLSGKTKIDAFNDAVLAIKTKYKQPYYWGAFKLLGS